MQTAKCVVVGDHAVGKSCLLVCYTKNVFPVYNHPSFPDTLTEVLVDGRAISLHLWDTAAQEEYDGLRRICYPNTNICIICFSIMSPPSYESVKKKWYPEVAHHCPRIPIHLVGTKLDLRHNVAITTKQAEPNKVPISTQQGIHLAKQIRAVGYMECSALNKEGVKDVFEEAARVVLHHRAKSNV